MEGSYSAAVPSVESDMMVQFLGAHQDHCFAYEHDHESVEAMAATMFLPGLETDSNSSSAWGHTASADIGISSFLTPAQSYESFEFPGAHSFPATDFEPHCTIPSLCDDLSPLHDNHSSIIKEEETNGGRPVTNKRKYGAAVPASMKSKKTCKRDYNGNDEDSNGNVDTQSSSSCTSEEGSLEGNAKSSSKKTATRASRGAATDPQSLYARKRRERINERLRILQNLVPNGTKVDISTMLEEAVQYVKFLQIQIKLLSSDDLWMYAPIAYNGVNISNVDLNISSLQK